MDMAFKGNPRTMHGQFLGVYEKGCCWTRTEYEAGKVTGLMGVTKVYGLLLTSRRGVKLRTHWNGHRFYGCSRTQSQPRYLPDSWNGVLRSVLTTLQVRS